MTTKSYTDLPQSKKLAEILPLESADMHYATWTILDGEFIVSPNQGSTIKSMQEDYGNQIIPCWSLTALLSVMPQINEWITPYGHKNDKLFQFEPKICKMWEHSIMPSYKVTYGNELSTDIYDNPVDACYEMILKLHELKSL
jgi:hypothetical protein